MVTKYIAVIYGPWGFQKGDFCQDPITSKFIRKSCVIPEDSFENFVYGLKSLMHTVQCNSQLSTGHIGYNDSPGKQKTYTVSECHSIR